MEPDFDLSQIAATFKYGSFSGESRKRILVAYCFFASFMWIGMVALIVAISLEQVDAPMPTAAFVFTIIGISVAMSFLPVIWLVVIVKNEKQRREIALWLQDAIEADAQTESLGVWHPAGLFPSEKIQVAFDIGGIRYTRESMNDQTWNGLPKGYHRCWANYSNKKIKILYSAKYDQVMILKNRENNS